MDASGGELEGVGLEGDGEGVGTLADGLADGAGGGHQPPATGGVLVLNVGVANVELGRVVDDAGELHAVGLVGGLAVGVVAAAALVQAGDGSLKGEEKHS